MDLLTGIGGFGESLWSYLIPFLFVLTVVVFFHELGHFAVARWCGVKVSTFSIGFGREIVGWNDRHGTRWKVSWIPLGGYVKFAGDENAASVPNRQQLEQTPVAERAGLFHFKPLPQRAAVVAAGPIANFILATVIFAGIFTFVGRSIATPVVDDVRPDSAAAVAGFAAGDRILTINGNPIASFEEMQRIVSTNSGSELRFEVVRGGETLALEATPQVQEITDRFGNVHRIAMLGIVRHIDSGNVEIVRSDPVTALWLGAKETWFVAERTLSYIGGIFTGTEDADQLGGPLRIAQVSGQVATIGFAALISMTAMLSVSIGLLNLFPVPMLDGGHLLYYAVEAVRGRPLGEQAQEYGFRIGLALVMMLMVFATWNDLVHLQVFSFLSGLFS
ncbi:RIP metalloprotease RseP [Parvibaculum sp.]|uniref:RIP metalloprotease RseP n=1 Tax=Parvibaculum sp. TaxID=2024848 RepID=UPI002732258E|nr:RIP metalloprotease RseP [Parvibaculum sp.]MDP1627946.1 RIP metalloprotease RseP [Parvibaculum sp.]MDP2150944.1 RIP metalloprotease RseP [Parvibaculum sp.]MDP3327459.1 RIP metalloprotease RseP [Parvibaculum sp.]